MLTSSPFHRRGMTLIELLVVVAILGLLAVTVVPTLATTSETRRTREAALVVSTYVAQAQTRAVGQAEWSGFWIIAASNSSSTGVDLAFAEVPELYRGDTVGGTDPAAPTGNPRGLTFSTGAVSSVGVGSGLVNVRQYDLIRFDGRGPWYELVAVSAGGAGSMRLRTHASAADSIEDAGQTERNTPWPAASVNHSFEILRYPEAVGTPSPIPNGRVIDLYWSGFGPDGAAETFATGDTRFFADLTPPQFGNVAVLFDSTGRVRKVVGPSISGGSAISERKSVTGPVFLLVGRADRAGQTDPTTFSSTDDATGCNWQYGDSYWIGIDPMSGIIRTAACTPGATTVIQSQAWIRQNLLESGG